MLIKLIYEDKVKQEDSWNDYDSREKFSCCKDGTLYTSQLTAKWLRILPYGTAQERALVNMFMLPILE